MYVKIRDIYAQYSLSIKIHNKINGIEILLLVIFFVLFLCKKKFIFQLKNSILVLYFLCLSLQPNLFSF